MQNTQIPDKHFEELRNKYRIVKSKNKTAKSPLYTILLKMEKKENLSESDIKWLEADEQFVFLGNYYGWLVNRTADDTYISKANYYYDLQLRKSEIRDDLKAAKIKTTLEFNRIFKKYSIPHQLLDSIDLTLHEIITAVETGGILSDEKVKWLEDQNYFSVLGYYFQECHNRTKDPWLAIRSGGFWRKAQQPYNTLKVTEGLSSSEEKIQAAILTNRGGAYRDLGQLQEAKQNAELAIELQPKSFYAFNLLGAICYQQGEPQEGDLYFSQALELGSSPRTQEGMVKTAFDDANDDDKDVIARHLVNKDSVAYSWAKKYIKKNE